MSEATVGGLCGAWITGDDIKAIPKYANVDIDLANLVAPVVSEWLYMKSGQQWPGICEETVRPCCGHSVDRCSCACTSILDLGVYPIQEITEIKIDGAVFSPTLYNVWDYRYIRRLDAEGWPSCQDLRLPATEVNTFEVSLTFGNLPSLAGLLAAKVMGGEVVLAITGDDNCKLPRALVSSVVRQGVTLAFRNSTETLEHGLTGVHEVDLWLTTIPSGLRSAGPSQVFVPEFHKKSTQRTWP